MTWHEEFLLVHQVWGSEGGDWLAGRVLGRGRRSLNTAWPKVDRVRRSKKSQHVKFCRRNVCKTSDKLKAQAGPGAALWSNRFASLRLKAS